MTDEDLPEPRRRTPPILAAGTEVRDRSLRAPWTELQKDVDDIRDALRLLNHARSTWPKLGHPDSVRFLWRWKEPARFLVNPAASVDARIRARQALITDMRLAIAHEGMRLSAKVRSVPLIPGIVGDLIFDEETGRLTLADALAGRADTATIGDAIEDYLLRTGSPGATAAAVGRRFDLDPGAVGRLRAMLAGEGT